MRRLSFAANWKMHFAPAEARAYFAAFLPRYPRRTDRDVWFFPPAISIEAAVQAVRDRDDLAVGAQDVHWEPKGAFTGAVSAPLVAQAGARAVLIGHSERRHVFGESDADTGRKVHAVLAAGLLPVLCVGETLAQREAGETMGVVTRQLAAALGPLNAGALEHVTVAYEPVWAIGTGRNATPRDAAAVHRHIRGWLAERRAPRTRVLYGGSVSLSTTPELLAEPELDGVLVGGASLDPTGWAQLVLTGAG
ncbi:MAG: triose-phosphate isomerase [Gemmatimonadales bacterium]